MEPIQSNEKVCPYCAETIKAQAKICRFCNRDQPEPAANVPASAPKKYPDIKRSIDVSMISRDAETFRGSTAISVAKAPTSDGGSAFLRIVGTALVICGLGASVYYFLFFDTSVELPQQAQSLFGTGRVNNIGLIADKQNGIIFGFGAFIVGVLLLYVGRVKPT